MFDERFEGYKALMPVTEKVYKPGKQKVQPYHWMKAFNPSEDTVYLNGFPIAPGKTLYHPPIDNHVYVEDIDIIAPGYVPLVPPTQDGELSILRQADFTITNFSSGVDPLNTQGGDPTYKFLFKPVLTNVVNMPPVGYQWNVVGLVGTNFSFNQVGNDCEIFVSTLEQRYILFITGYATIAPGLFLAAQTYLCIKCNGEIESWECINILLREEVGNIFMYTVGNLNSPAILNMSPDGFKMYYDDDINPVTYHNLSEPLPAPPMTEGTHIIKVGKAADVNGGELLPPVGDYSLGVAFAQRLVDVAAVEVPVVGVQNPQELLILHFGYARFTK